MRRSTAWAVTVLALSGLLLVLTPGPASAHEEVNLGKVSFEIGFDQEPAYAGSQNSVFLSIHDSKDRPVTDAADTLNVEVVYGSQTMKVALEPNFTEDTGGSPGQYQAYFIPTRPGKYTFHLFGSIDGVKIDRSFTSSPTSFDEVVDPTAVEFPVKDPTIGQVAERLTRELPRQESAIASAQKAAATALAAASSAKDGGDSARTLAVVGIVVGALGLAAGAGAMVAERRSRHSVAAGSAEQPARGS